MIDQNWPRSPPKTILLATDLSSRGDRALDRAAQLARQWNARLVVVHAIEGASDGPNWSDLDDAPSWRRPPEAAIAIERQIRRDLREEVDDLLIHIEEGDPVQVILATIEREECDLVVLGTARDELFGRMLLGDTVEHIVRKSPVSVLIVKTRPHGAYRHLLIGSDFTEESKRGLSVAAKLFPDAAFTVMHAFVLPYRALLLDNKLSRDFAAMEMASIETFIEEAGLPSEIRQRVLPIIEHGLPEAMLRKYIVEQGADLTVIGAFGRGIMFHVFIGGTARRIVDAAPSDVLVVRARRETERRTVSTPIPAST